MIVYFCDGSTLTCNTIEFNIDTLIFDGYRTASIREVEKVETSDTCGDDLEFLC